MIHQVIYHSRAMNPGAHVSDLDILRQAIAFNSENSVTGFLLKTYDHFIQVLEGEQNIVTRLVHMIQQDPRHCEVATFPCGTLPQRQFSNWSMGYAYVDNLPISATSPTDPQQRALWIEDMRRVLLDAAKTHRS